MLSLKFQYCCCVVLQWCIIQKPPETSGNLRKPPETSGNIWNPWETDEQWEPFHVSKRFADQSVSKRFRKQCRDAIAAGMDENVFTDWSKKYNRIQDVPKVKAETAKGYIEAESAAYELLIAALPQQARMELTGDDSNVRLHPFRMNEKWFQIPFVFFGARRCWILYWSFEFSKTRKSKTRKPENVNT